jgi:hypothetical protein
MSPTEIAENIGCSVNSLRVRCSQLGISLSRKRIEIARSKQHLLAPLTVHLSRRALDGLWKNGGSQNMSRAEFAATLLETIARDDLYRAILDHD